MVKDLYVGKRSGNALPEARMKIREIHDAFKAQLHALGFTEAQWPFNTKNCGYKSLAGYLNRFRDQNGRATVAARSGVEAARRQGVGNGRTPLIPVLRPFSFVQMDYHKVDAASVIILKNDASAEFEVPLARWQFGLIAEEFSGAVTGFCIVLALNPSGDDALEVVQHAILPSPEGEAVTIAIPGLQLFPAWLQRRVHSRMPDFRAQTGAKSEAVPAQSKSASIRQQPQFAGQEFVSLRFPDNGRAVTAC